MVVEGATPIAAQEGVEATKVEVAVTAEEAEEEATVEVSGSNLLIRLSCS